MTLSDNDLLDPQSGYDIVAPDYELWRWFKFWRLNEAPIVRHWIRRLQPGRGLDAGSGTGPYIPDILRAGHRCVALDISREMLRINERKVSLDSGAQEVSFVQADVSKLPFKDAQFDWILCSRVLSHVSNLRTVLNEFARVLKSGGQCLISDVHPDHPYEKVGIPAAKKRIWIETYKHSLNYLRETISSINSLRLLNLSEYGVKNLFSEPSRLDFEKLYRSPNTAVFYVCSLEKR